MTTSWPDAPIDFHRITKVIVVIDVVESVKLMEQDEYGFIQHWQQFVRRLREEVLPVHAGRLHKSLGDGLMLEFNEAHQGVRAGLEAHLLCQELNRLAPATGGFQVRIGAHLAQFVADEHDIYGADVNMAARITTLAGPGEIVVTSQVRDHLTAGLDAEIEDLGECHLKHLNEPVRAYRVGAVGREPVIPPQEAPADFRPTIAVIPFHARSNQPEHFVVGELIADGVIAQLSRSPDLRVISRLSTTAFRGRSQPLDEIESRLRAAFILSGSYAASGDKVLISVELADARTNGIIWADRISGPVADLLEAQSALLNQIAVATSRALIDAEVQRSLVQPMPRLDSSALLLGGISMMHRSSVREFERSRQALDALIERHGRIATPRAWLAKWYIMKVIRGLSDAPQRDTRLALEQTKRALDSEPSNALTLAVEGYAHCQLLGNYELATDRLTESISSNPNEPMAWLFKSVLSTMWGSAEDSVHEVETALTLSPIDPLRYYFDLLLSSALLTNNQHERAIERARQSLRANRHHSPTLRVLLTAQAELGLAADAAETLRALMAEEPGLTVSSYLGMGSAASVTRQRCAAAMRALGVPE
ncbi:MAG: adenylate/guanylate cyclase domain-containing protein [Ramlibacter sp.]